MSQVVTWSILGQDGSVTKGSGTRPPDGWFNEVRACIGLGLRVLGHPPIYAVRPTCSHDVDRGLTRGGADYELERFWGVQPEPGSTVWFFPGGDMVGFGRDTNEVGRLLLAFQGKLKASEVAGGPDQRGRPESV